MPNSQRISLVAGLLVLLTAAGFFLLRDDRARLPLEAVPTGEAEAVASPEAAAAEPEAPADGAVSVRQAVAERDAAEDAEDAELDPEVRRALAGFKGRVVHHDGAPAANTRVVLYRIDAQVAVGTSADLLGSETIDPALDAGDASTDEDGRFLLSGVWPRSLYVLRAGLGSDNPLAMFVERTPGAGEIVDLGEIRLPDGAVLTGTVLRSDGEPCAGAVVRVIDIPAALLSWVPLERFHPEGALLIPERRQAAVIAMPRWVKQRFEQLPLPAARTGADGTFRVTGIEAGTHSLVVTAPEHIVHVKQNLKLQAGAEKDVGTIELDEGEEAYGKVVDAESKPVAGAEVLIGQGGAAGHVYLATPAIRADEKGTFAHAGFKSGRVVVAARRGPGEPWSISEPQPVASDLLVTLPASFSLTVSLTSAAGHPITEPRLRLLTGPMHDGAIEMARFGFSSEIALAERSTALGEGRFRIERLAPGVYTVLADAAGHAVAGQQVELQGNAEVRLQLDLGASLVVAVADRAQKPVRSATVYCNVRGREGTRRVTGMPLPVGRTGADGQLAVRNLAPGEVRISAEHPAFGWTHAVVQVPGAVAKLVFDTPGSVEGVLTDAGAVPELGKWTIILMHRGEREAMPAMPRFTMPDAEGKFAVRGLQPGTYDAQVIETLSQFHSPGAFITAMTAGRGEMMFDRPERNVEVRAGQTSFLDLDTGTKQEVTGPAGHVSGSAFVNGRPAAGFLLTGWGEHGRVSGEVDATGRFDLGRVRAGNLYLQLVDQESGLIGRQTMWSKSLDVVADQNIDLDIQLTTASLSGDVVGPDGAAAPGVRVMVSGMLATDGEDQQGASSHLNTVTDEQGHFELPRLSAGKYSVRAEEASLGVGRAEIEVRSGYAESVRVQLLATVTVSGRVDYSGLADKPRQGWLTLRRDGAPAESGGWAEIDEQGAFQCEDIVPGTYRASMWLQFGDTSKEYVDDTPIRVGSAAMRDLVLHPKPNEPPPPAPKTEEQEKNG
jgi:hypothetical protein